MKVGTARRLQNSLGFGSKLLASLAILAAVAMVVFVSSLFLWSREIDIGARLHEEGLVRHGVQARIAEIERAISPQTNWDEALVHLDHDFNSDWADENLSAYLAQVGAFEDIFVIDAEGRAVYASHNGETAPLANFDHLGAALGLIADVRLAETRRAPITPISAASHRMLTQPIQASGVVMIDGAPFLVTATLVQTDFGRAQPRGAHAPVVVTSAPLDAAVLEPVRERLQLSAMTALFGRPAGLSDDLATTTINTHFGGPALTLAWTPRRPGAELLHRALFPVILLVLALGAVGVAMVSRARRAANDLIASNRAQSEFLANMSHEIRTPLNGVVAIAGVLERSDLSDHQAELVRIIRSSGETLERLLSDVLDLSKIETGAIAMEREPFDLAEAVRAVAALCRPRAEEKGVALEVEIAPAAEALVLGDVVRVKQIITNLTSNAVKFTEAGRVVLRVLAGRGEGTWRIEVEDTGVGFDPSQKTRIFSRFQQADGSVTRRYGGTGLGLSISSQLVELMGGVLDCDSRPGAGSIFTADLPLPVVLESLAPTPPRPVPPVEPATAPPPAAAAEPPAAAPAAAMVEPAERRLRVLLADDHPTNRTVVQVLLGEMDVDLVSVENGQEACEAFEADRFDVVLMDMQMPVMDGLTAVRRLRAHERRRGAAPALMVMLTANAMREHHDQSLEAGADLHLAKPIQAARLFAALELGMERTIAAAKPIPCAAGLATADDSRFG